MSDALRERLFRFAPPDHPDIPDAVPETDGHLQPLVAPAGLSGPPEHRTDPLKWLPTGRATERLGRPLSVNAEVKFPRSAEVIFPTFGIW